MCIEVPGQAGQIRINKFTEHGSAGPLKTRCIMKSSRIMIGVAVTMFLLVASAVAQSGAIRVSVPFDFTVGKQTLMAGEYNVSISGSLLQVARIGSPGVAIVSTNLTGGGPNENPAPRLVFHCYENHHFLSIAWIGEINQGHELYASAAELQYARAMKQEQTVVLASRTPKR